jgi:magnesium chelatase accessory protein
MDPRRLPPDWPFRALGRMTRAGPHDWWVIDTGPPPGLPDAPALLLLHGLGASGHSFRRMIPGLAARFRVIVPDLPGQGCTRAGNRARLGLDPMAQDLATLCRALGAVPGAVIGHSAGAAIALQMAANAPIPAVIGINAALGDFDGAAGVLFPLMAQGLALMPFAASAMSRLGGTEARIARLLAGTGSPLDAAGRAQYLALVRDTDHVAGALGMMSQWRLTGLRRRLPGLGSRVLLIAARGDRAVPPAVSHDAARSIPGATVLDLPGGHLVHEEMPDGLSALILDWLQPASAAPKIVSR